MRSLRSAPAARLIRAFHVAIDESAFLSFSKSEALFTSRSLPQMHFLDALGERRLPGGRVAKLALWVSVRVPPERLPDALKD